MNKLYSIGVEKHRILLYFLLFLSFLLSMNIWIGWEERGHRLNLIVGLLAFLLMIFNRVKFSFTRTNIIVFFLIVLGRFFYGYEPSIFLPFHFLSYFLIICLNDQDKVRCLEFVTKWFGYLMLPSLIVYALVSFIDLPYFGIQHASDADWAADSGYGICKNYIFYMRSEFGDYTERFNGPFLEPGHLGMMSAFLLFVNQFDFRRKGMWLILLALIFTFSLSGYVLLFFGFLFTAYYKGKITAKHILLYSLLFFIVYLFGMYYNGGDNILYEKIFSRLEYDKEKGFAGNNRVFGLIDVYYAALWNDMDTLLWGYPKETMEWLADTGSRGTGYVMSMCIYGLVGTCLSMLFYFVYSFTNKNKKYAILCLLFVCLMFWQRCYPFWTSWIICFFYGITMENIGFNKKNSL